MNHTVVEPNTAISQGKQTNQAAQEAWHELPHSLPKPTYWPAALALGTALTFLGITTTYIVSMVGLILLGISIGGWIWEIRNAANE
jgi:hypothetical protein